MKKSPETSVNDARATRRGRPRTFDRDKALEQATLVFWKKGFEATSIVDLTDAIGIEAPSLYAAFGSKEALYRKAVDCYVDRFQGAVWSNFLAAPTAREAVAAYLQDSATALAGSSSEYPRGCMVTLANIDSDAHPSLAVAVSSARSIAFDRLSSRIAAAVDDGELPLTTDVPARARFIQTVQSGMSLIARDGADRSDLVKLANTAMSVWDLTA